ncbi:MAG TPA: N-acetylmuramoyl-L-alanine amidase [Edaphobacter sp.]|nr:N-acetylmuramoyl-L-alanine amidase [Edaphobacter sp.]
MAACKKMQGRWVWCAVCAAGLGCGVVAGASTAKAKSASGQRRVVEMSPWEQATQGREELEAMPEGSRTKADYAKAMDGYRGIYHDAPQSKYAAAAVNAVAELLAEQGRGLQDAKSMKAAVGQYEFLRTQYPGSSLRVGALLAEAQIYENDLHDTALAKEKYALLVKQYPKSAQAEEARAGRDSLKQGEGKREEGRGKGEAVVVVESADRTRGVDGRTNSGAALPVARDGVSTFAPMPVTRSAGSLTALGSVSASSKPAPVSEAGAMARRGTAAPVDEVPDGAEQSVGAGLAHVAKTSGVKRKDGLAQVTGIRHWSTPNYTRVAIDLGDDVTYEAARVPNPDRIYFDLHGTRLAQELVGKNFAVTDDGFLKKIRAAQFSNDMTRVVLDVNDVTEYSAFLLPNPYRLIIDIHGGAPLQVATKDQGAAPQVTNTDEVPAPRTAAVGKTTPGKPVPNTVATKNASTTTDVAALSEQPGKVEATSVPTSRPISAIVPVTGSREEGVGSREQGSTDIAVAGGMGSTGKRSKKGKTSVDPAVPARAAVPTADGQTSLVRALGLKIGRIVIDAGHGGHDSGTLGVDGLEEKDVVLDVALRLGKILHDRLGAEIIYTRSDDTFIPLETRTAIANKAQADLFLSIHANSSNDPTARGVETYYLNFTSSPDALETAARENAVSDQSINQLSDLVKKIALKEKIDESREFASDVEAGLYSGLQKGNAGLKNRGVKKAPFVVLIGANMPSILAEISFVTNPKDAGQLRLPEYRQRVAESLYKGVAKYAGGLSGTRQPTERASSK